MLLLKYSNIGLADIFPTNTFCSSEIFLKEMALLFANQEKIYYKYLGLCGFFFVCLFFGSLKLIPGQKF